MSGLRTLRNQRGMSLVTAIFILVVLAAIGGYMVLVSGVQSRTTVMALQGARAFHAARSSLEWGINRSLTGGVCAADSFALDGFRVAVSCDATPFIEAGQAFTVFRIAARAEWGRYGDADYVSRQVSVRVTDALP